MTAGSTIACASNHPVSGRVYPRRDDIRGSVRRTTVELRNIATQGPIIVPVVFAAGVDSLPDRLHCSFTIQASRSGTLGRTVRVAVQDSLPLTEG